jgi:alpha-tubulin suppressor-like RCC1 family protein
MKGAKAVSAGVYGDVCAVLADSSVRCWGQDPRTGTSDSTWTVSNISGATAIGMTSAGGCALLSNGTVACWGVDDLGQLGNGTVTQGYAVAATPVPDLSGVTAVASGYDFTCALRSNGEVVCWGRDITEQASAPNCGEDCSPSPRAVPLSGVAAITAGMDFACALLADGTVACWGDNDEGALGDGTTAPWSTTPVAVLGLTNVTAVSASGYHVCAVIADGAVACWGRDRYGELGAPAPQTCVDPCSRTPIRFQP